MSTADPRSPLPGAAWGRAEPPPPPRAESRLARALGGSPGVVVLRLIVLSFLAGALLMWLDLKPLDILLAFERFARHVWNLGFEAVRDVLQYVAAGALIVVPLWALSRVLSVRTLR